ncbi:RNA polymerase sigma factor [Streptomyces sp. NPDC059166]|uniref:RNA polymerase sigma factor n=1 Tax=Streptomyces sp. NPDC059166 TaxID=3346752 RepID=UPI003674D375
MRTREAVRRTSTEALRTFADRGGGGAREPAGQPAGGRTDSEASVIARVRAGDTEAYAQLVRAHTGVALRAAVAFGAGADAEDVVQAAFFKAYRALGGFRDGEPFRPWLLRIVMNETRNAVRSAGRARAAAGREAFCLGPHPVIPDAVDPAEATLAQERRALLVAALGELSEEQRQVVTCRYLLEMGEAETARALGWPRGTVKSRLNRALRKLEGRLDGQLAPERKDRRHAPERREDPQDPVGGTGKDEPAGRGRECGR